MTTPADPVPTRSNHPHPSGKPGTQLTRPGWIEIAAAAVGYLVLVFPVGLPFLRLFPDNSASKGLAEFGLSAVAGLGAFALAYAIRIRRLPTFGIRRVQWRWIFAGAGFGLLAFGLGAIVSVLYLKLTGDTQNIQSNYQAAASGGVPVLLATLLLGSVATAIGEEFAWRGVLTNALGRFPGWIAVLGSAIPFALAHGLNPVFPRALIEGTIAAILFRKTGSVWPGVMVHLVNNAVASLINLAL